MLKPSPLQKDRQAAGRAETSLSQSSPRLLDASSHGDLHPKAFEALLEPGRGTHWLGRAAPPEEDSSRAAISN